MDQDLKDKLDSIEAKIVAGFAKKEITNIFGIPIKKSIAPGMSPISEIDYSIYISNPTKSYYSYVQEYGGPKGLTAEIMSHILMKDTFYDPIIDFMIDYPSFFPGVSI